MELKDRTTDIAYSLIEGLIGILAVVFNILLLKALWKYRRLRTLTTKIVVNLGTSNIFAGVVTAVLTALPPFDLPSEFAHCLLVSCLVRGAFNNIVLSLALVVVDRYYHVFHCKVYLGWVSEARVCGLLVVSWLVSLLLGLVPIVWHKHPDRFQYCSLYGVLQEEFEIYFHFAFFYVPVVVTLSVLFARAFTAFRHCKRHLLARRSLVVPAAAAACPSDNALHAKDLFLFKKLLVLFCLQVLTFLPHYLLMALRLWARPGLEDLSLGQYLQLPSHTGFFLTPLIYIYNRREFHPIVTNLWPARHKDSAFLHSMYGKRSSPRLTSSSFHFSHRRDTTLSSLDTRHLPADGERKEYSSAAEQMEYPNHPIIPRDS